MPQLYLNNESSFTIVIGGLNIFKVLSSNVIVESQVSPKITQTF